MIFVFEHKLKPAIIGGSICHAFNPEKSFSIFLLDFLFAGYYCKKLTLLLIFLLSFINYPRSIFPITYINVPENIDRIIFLFLTCISMMNPIVTVFSRIS